MTKRHLIIAGILFPVLAILVWSMARLPVAPRNQPVVLPDGSVVTFAGTTYGKKVQIPPTGSWKRNLAFLPDSILQRLKIYPGPRLPVPTNHIMIWLFINPPGSIGLFQSSTVAFSLVDENGVECYSPNFMPYGFSSYARANGPSLQGLDLGAFPRRSRAFKLRVYAKDPAEKLSLLGELNIRNPAFQSYPDWRAASLPETQTNGGVEIALTRLLTGLNWDGSRPADTNEETWGKAFFTFTEGGKPCADWMADTVEFSDATGNRVLPSRWGYSQPKPSRGIFRFGAPLWPAESAWKLNATFMRKPGAKFAAGELWSIRHLPLPGLNSTNSLNLKTNVNGIDVELLDLVDESGMLPPETRKDYRRVRLDFEVADLPPDLRFDIVSVTGQDEGKNSDSGRQTAQCLGTTGRTYMYMTPASVRGFVVKTAVYRQLTAEYTVKPAMLSATNAVKDQRR